MLDWLQLGVALIGSAGIFFLGLGVLTLAKRSKEVSGGSGEGVKISLLNLNEKAKKTKRDLQAELLSKDALKALQKQEKKADKEAAKSEKALAKAKGSEAADDDSRKRVFVLDFHGDIQASQVTLFREAVTALGPLLRKDKDEVVVRVESPGGLVHAYGLAAAQILRLRDSCARLVVCVDKVAASGGYMLACTAHEIVASPFAIIGSIGAVAGIPNVSRLLKDKKIDYYEMTAGKYKRTVSVLGEVTDEKLEKAKRQLEDVHELFKSHVSNWRPNLDMETVATGEYWYGLQALSLGLVDKLMTSDAYLGALMDSADVFEVKAKEKENLRSRIMHKCLGSVARFAGFRLERELGGAGAHQALWNHLSESPGAEGSKPGETPWVLEKLDLGV